jgi:type IV secretory pathway TrbD component
MTRIEAQKVVTAYAIDRSIQDGSQPVMLRRALQRIAIGGDEREINFDDGKTALVVTGLVILTAWTSFGLGFLFGWGLVSLRWW